ncbi:MAG: ATP-binding protein [Candidatus Diapherotrites archaeon]|nr:ATP-binding protein [Candidatus Diapherotrites archaeon]
MDKKTLDFILGKGEDYRTEFKENLNGIEKDIVAFANAEGGNILVGVSDNNQIKGIEINNRLKAEVQSIARNCDTSIPIEVSEFGNVLIVTVPESEGKPHRCSQGFYLRIGSTSQKLEVEEIRELFNRQGKLMYEEMVNTDFSTKDFGTKKFNEFLKKAGISKTIPKKDLLYNLGLTSQKGKFKNAAILFFGKNPSRFIPQGIITCVLYKGMDKARIIDKKDFKSDVVSNYSEAFNFLYRNLKLRYEIKGFGPRKEILEIPEEALKEAIINSICHRDYGEKGAVTQIDIFDDRVEISNPGGLIFKESDFGKRSFSRNPLLFGLLQQIELVEHVGSGIGRIRKALLEAGLPKPKFEFTTFFTVTFLRPALKDTISDTIKDTIKTENELKIIEEMK